MSLQEDMKFYDNMEVLYHTRYSKTFRRKLKRIKTAQNPQGMFLLIMKRVAVFVVVGIISFSALLAVNVKAREMEK